MLDTVHMKELSSAAARQKYRTHLDDKGRPKQDKQKAERREGLMEKITKEKKRVEEDVRLVRRSADCNAEKKHVLHLKVWWTSKTCRKRK